MLVYIQKRIWTQFITDTCNSASISMYSKTVSTCIQNSPLSNKKPDIKPNDLSTPTKKLTYRRKNLPKNTGTRLEQTNLAHCYCEPYDVFRVYRQMFAPTGNGSSPFSTQIRKPGESPWSKMHSFDQISHRLVPQTDDSFIRRTQHNFRP